MSCTRAAKDSSSSNASEMPSRSPIAAGEASHLLGVCGHVAIPQLCQLAEHGHGRLRGARGAAVGGLLVEARAGRLGRALEQGEVTLLELALRIAQHHADRAVDRLTGADRHRRGAQLVARRVLHHQIGVLVIGHDGLAGRDRASRHPALERVLTTDGRLAQSRLGDQPRLAGVNVHEQDRHGGGVEAGVDARREPVQPAVERPLPAYRRRRVPAYLNCHLAPPPALASSSRLEASGEGFPSWGTPTGGVEQMRGFRRGFPCPRAARQGGITVDACARPGRCWSSPR